MRNVNAVLGIVILLLLSVLLSACGASSPAGGNAAPTVATPAVPAGKATNITMTVRFPATPTPAMGLSGLNPLISASTKGIDLNIYAGAGNVSVPVNTFLGSARITAPAGGGTASGTVTLNQVYAGPVTINIDADDNSAPGVGWASAKTGHLIQHANVALGNNTVTAAMVEYGQGVSAFTPVTLKAPDNRTYTMSSIYFPSGFNQWEYNLGITATDASGTVGVHYLSQNKYGVWSNWSVAYYPAVNAIVDGVMIVTLELPDALNTMVNRYDVKLNFAPAGIPTNTPTISGTFVGTFSYMLNASATAWGIFPASGTAGANFTIPNAVWANNVLPPAPPNVGVVIF